MPEPITTVGLGVIAAYLGKDGLAKLLGPTAEYLGSELQEFTKNRIENVGKIFSKAEIKLGPDIDKPGQVPPKVLKTIINEGSYCEDAVAVDYFGGILASSRTGLGRDDRGGRVARMLDGMSTYQIRTHYIIYSFTRKIFHDSGYVFNMEDRPNMELFIPWDSYILSMQFDKKERDQLTSILNHSFFGLNSDGLIEAFQYGPKEHIKKHYDKAEEGGIIVQPSALGAELYLWGHGKGDKELSYALNNDLIQDLEDIPLILDGVAPSSKKHNKQGAIDN